MSNSLVGNLFLAVCLLASVVALSIEQDQSSVKLIKSVDLAGYTGDFDHFAVDYDRNRLLLAAEDHGSIEIFDLKTSAHLRTVGGFGNPHSILARKGVPTLFFSSCEKQMATLRQP